MQGACAAGGLSCWVDRSFALPLSRLLPLILLLIRSFETTSHSISWVLYDVACHPEVQAKMEAELREAGLLGPGRRPLEFADLSSLR